jgi:hypothetical protein
MLKTLAAKATAAKFGMQERMADEAGLETAEKLVITAIVVVLAVGVFIFLAGVVNDQAGETGNAIADSDTTVGTPTL